MICLLPSTGEVVYIYIYLYKHLRDYYHARKQQRVAQYLKPMNMEHFAVPVSAQLHFR